MKDIFLQQLASLNVPRSPNRKKFFVAYDQLTDKIGPLAQYPSQELHIILIESLWKSQRRPYHKQKICFILSNMRHFALEQARRGVHVEYIFSTLSYKKALISRTRLSIFGQSHNDLSVLLLG